jgi:hypothetical protein
LETTAKAPGGEALPDFLKRGDRGLVQGDVEQAEGDGALKLVFLDIGLNANRTLATVSAKRVLQPLGAVTAEASQIFRGFAAMLHLVGRVLVGESVEGVQAVVILGDARDLQVLVEEDGSVTAGAADFEEVAGDLASLIEAFDEEGEMLGRKVVPISGRT